MNVLSLFDGMSCGQQALERSGVRVDNYFASEIDKYAIKVTQANYPKTNQLGSVIDVDGYSLPNIDLLLGGSPCQSFSFAGKRKGMSTKDEQEILTLEHYLKLKSEGFEFEGQSYLFWEYMRLLKEVKPKYFLLENVMMGNKWEKILSKAIGVNPIEINSSLVSAQNRRRLYWTNIGMIPSGLFGDLESVIQQPKDKGIVLRDVIEKEVDNKYFLSSKIISGFERHKNRHEAKGTGFGFKPKNGSEKGNCLRANASLCPTDNMILTPTNILNNGKTIGKEIKKAHTLLSRDYKGFNTYGSNGVVVNKINLLILDCYNNNFRNDGKVGTITQHMSRSGMTNGFKAIIDSRIRRLTPVECERLQTVKDNYTNHVSDTQRYKMLGNGWTVDVISHILNYIK
jgi:DNA (cytosine-5)-methyltransferase 1